MVYSDEFKVCWFTPLRIGARSTHDFLSSLNFQNLNTHSFHLPSNRLDYTLISNIRNPYSRIVSIFHLYCLHQKNFNLKFNEWIIAKSNERQFTINYQIDYHKKILETKKSFIFVRLENFVEDIKSLNFINPSQEKTKILFEEKIKVNCYNKEFEHFIGKEKKSWPEFYDENLADFVYNYLREQFDFLNYNKDSWKNGTP